MYVLVMPGIKSLYLFRGPVGRAARLVTLSYIAGT